MLNLINQKLLTIKNSLKPKISYAEELQDSSKKLSHEFTSKNLALFMKIVEIKEDGELADKCRSHLEEYSKSLKLPPFPTEFDVF